MRKISAIVIILLLTIAGFSTAFCQNEKPAIDKRHSVRIGWGDMLFETMAFRPKLSGTWATPSALPDNYVHNETFKYGYRTYLR